MAICPAALRNILHVVLFFLCFRLNYATEDGLYMDILTTNRRISQVKCEDINFDSVKEFNISSQYEECACKIQLQDSTSSAPVIESNGRRWGSRVKLGANQWDTTSIMVLTLRNREMSLVSCDLTYEQPTPVTVKIGEDGVRLTCTANTEDVIGAALCRDTVPKSTEPSIGSDKIPHDKNLELHLGLIMAGGLVIAVFINIASLVIIRYKCRSKNAVKRRDYPARRHPGIRRQQTNQSHPYESIVMDPEAEMELDTADIAGSNVTVVLPGYLPMNGSSRDNLVAHVTESTSRSHPMLLPGTESTSHGHPIYADGTETETDLDALVYPPPSAHYAEGTLEDNQANSPGYSYAYSSTENLQMQEWPRKFSIESIDSAGALNKRIRELSLIHANGNGASFDSGYSERVSQIKEQNEDDEPSQTENKNFDISNQTKIQCDDKSVKRRAQNFDQLPNPTGQNYDSPRSISRGSTSDSESKRDVTNKNIGMNHTPSYIEIVAEGDKSDERANEETGCASQA